MAEFHFDDIIKVVQVDADVSRSDAKSQDDDTDIVLDVNSNLFPVNKNDIYRMVLSRTLNLDGSAVGNYYPEGKQKSLADKFEYVMHGLLYKVAEDSSKVVVYISFGGLQLKLRSDPLKMHKFKLDQRLFLLLRKMSIKLF